MSPSSVPGRPSASEQTRTALVLAALRLFGRRGYDGTSTRQIADAAKANIASIAYHFGSKDGLRMAVAEHVVRTIQSTAAPAFAEAGPMTALDPEAAHARLALTLDRVVGFIVAQPQAGEIVQFVLRELATPSPALDRIYDGVFEPTHQRMCALWAAATGDDPDSETTRLSVFTMIGQVVYFRIGREAVLRRMGWGAIGPVEADKIASVTRFNLEAVLSARKGEKP